MLTSLTSNGGIESRSCWRSRAGSSTEGCDLRSCAEMSAAELLMPQEGRERYGFRRDYVNFANADMYSGKLEPTIRGGDCGHAA